jgi:hypothetical protein
MANSLEAKIVVLGSQGVGKTSFVHRYVKNAFAPPSTQSTIGASFLTKRVIDVDTSTVVRLQIWDTAGQERFRSISKLYYRGTYHSTRPKSSFAACTSSRLPSPIVSPSSCPFPCLCHSLQVSDCCRGDLGEHAAQTRSTFRNLAVTFGAHAMPAGISLAS